MLGEIAGAVAIQCGEVQQLAGVGSLDKSSCYNCSGLYFVRHSKVNGAEKSKGKSKDSKGKRKNAGKPKGKSKDGKGNDCGRKVKNTAARSRNV